MPHPSERSIVIKTSAIVKVIVIIAACGFLWLVRDVIALLVVALFLAALMHPAARWGAERRIPKGLTVIVIYILLISLVAASSALVIPVVGRQFGNLAQRISGSFTTISTSVESIRELSQQYGLADNLSTGLTSLQAQVSQGASGLFGALTGLFGGLVGLVVVFVMAFYMVTQEREAARMFNNFMPEKYRAAATRLLTQVEMKISRWLTGQLLLSLIIGILYYIGLSLLGIDGALVLALFGALAEFVPYLGPILGGIPVILVALSISPVMALFALGLMIIMQQLENQIIVPKVMQKAVGLNPLVSITAVLIGAKLFGIIGILLAIPVATTVSVVLSEIYRFRQEQN